MSLQTATAKNGYKIEQNPKKDGEAAIIEQCTYHGLKQYTFYSWNDANNIGLNDEHTVAIFKIVQRSK